jgi:peptidoglycan/LPS O-acetylase OafA/YrhL
MPKTGDTESSLLPPSPALSDSDVALLDPSVRKSEGFRTDIEGLRAVGILLIVGYHAGIPGFSGGFIGVDVFFVVSGYLITRRLLSDSAASGSVAFGTFWARRIRRLVPGLGLMVVATLIASFLIVAPFDMLEISKEAAASAVYVSNILFAQNAQNYFGADPNTSPFLHTWSLGVEEQFYLLWPFVVLGILLVSRRRPHIHRRVAIAVLALIAIGSFALNLRWTGDGSTWAFFSLPTRAWEFAAGGVLGLVLIRKSISPLVASIGGLAGFGLLVGATELFSPYTTYPGFNALVPVSATLLLILVGSNADSYAHAPFSRALSTRPMQWFGRLSYSWYLWHWPFIVLTVLAVNNGGVPVRTAAAIASLGVAYGAFRFVENPFRFNRRNIQSVRRTFVLGLVITVAVVAFAGGVRFISSRKTPDSIKQELAVDSQSFLPQCTGQSLPGDTYYCFGGDLKSSTTVALVGDSHADMWFNALSDVGTKDGFRVLLLAEPDCPFIPVDVRIGPDEVLDTSQCTARTSEGMRYLRTIKPAAVILAQHDFYVGSILDSDGNIPSDSEQVLLWKDAFRSFLGQMMAEGISPGVILDNPTLPESPVECASKTQSLSKCELSRSAAFAPGRSLQDAQLQVLSEKGDVPSLNPDTTLCNATGCPIQLDGQVLYADTNHLYYGATKLMEPQLSGLVKSLLTHNR